MKKVSAVLAALAMGLSLCAAAACVQSRDIGDDAAHADGGGVDGGPLPDSDASSDAGVDASGDAGSSGPCRGSQVFVGGACEYTCSGVRVPEDQPTIEAAATSLASKGGTICLGARAYDGAKLTIDVPITIIGISADQTSVASLAVTGSGAFTLKGTSSPKTSIQTTGLTSAVAVEGCTFAGNATDAALAIGPGCSTVSVVASRLSTQGDELVAALEIDYAGTPLTVTVDASELSGSSTSTGCGIRALSTDFTAGLTLSVTNSYFHELSAGIETYTPVELSKLWTSPLTVTDNTFTDAARGISTVSDVATLVLYNNVLTRLTVAGVDSEATIQQGANAFFANSENVTRDGSPQPNSVTAILTDPRLDATTVPPSLKTGSPCIGAGDAAHASDHDFFGKSRAPRVDVGAVQAN